MATAEQIAHLKQLAKDVSSMPVEQTVDLVASERDFLKQMVKEVKAKGGQVPARFSALVKYYNLD